MNIKINFIIKHSKGEIKIMLDKIKELFTGNEIISGNFGIEREALRVDESGNLATTDHPEIFGDKSENPYITTDFSESQVEVITPAFKKSEEAYKFTRVLYDIVATEIGR